MNKFNKGVSTLVAIIIIIVVAVVLFGGVFVYQYYFGNPNFKIQSLKQVQNSNVQTAAWKTFTNTKYGIEIKYPSGWTAKNAVVACTRDNGYTPPECADGIGEGVALTSTAPYNPLTNPAGILIMYRENLHNANPPEAGCTGAGNFNIGDKTFSRFVCGGVSDIVSYINKIKNTQGDILTGKYTAGPYFNDAFFNEYWQTGSDNKLVTYITDYNLGFDVLTDLKSYYAKNNSLPPDISAITPDIWCYDAVKKDQPIIDSEEKNAQQILSTFKFTNLTTTNPSPNQTAGWKTYTNTQYGFSVQYPSDFANVNDLTSAQKSSLQTYMGACLVGNNARIKPNQVGFCYVGTQTSDGFDTSSFNITADSSKSEQSCQQTNTSPIGELTTQVIVDGINFYEDKIEDAGLGHYLTGNSYRTYHNGTCFQIDLTIESDRGVSEKGLSSGFSNLMSSKLNSIISTFKFTK
jgi:hypothetical protein